MEQINMFEREGDQPLAARLRPRNLDEFVGQKHLLGEGKVLRRLIENDNVGSMIFWGPPGVGKTTLARIIAGMTKSQFIDFSAVTSGIKEIKQVMEQAERNRRFGDRTILFVDEIHRFNKAQQDAFLPYVEKGSIILIGATTENPSFEVNGALLSRCKVFVLQSLSADELVELLRHALKDNRGFGDQKVEIDDECLAMIANFANGDARSALSTLEMAVLNGDLDGETTRITRETVEQCTSKKSLLYDKSGEEHYNLISALHKSMRKFRPRRGCLLAGANARSGRRPDLCRKAGDPLCERGHRACRPARARDRGRGISSVPFDRHARVQRAFDRGGRLYVARTQIERALRRIRERQKGRIDHACGARSTCHPQRADEVDEGSRLRRRLSIRAQLRRQVDRHAMHARLAQRQDLLPPDRRGGRGQIQDAP